MTQDTGNNLSTRQVFRPEAIRRYMQSREEAVFPRLISPRVVIYLWVLLGLLGIAALFAWLVKVPIYVSGLAVVVDRSQIAQDIQDDVVLVAFFPPGHLQAGQNLLVQFSATGERSSREIVAVEPEISSPDAARRKFALEDDAALAITQPAIVAVARFQPTPLRLPARAYVGSTYRVDVEVGSRRLISLLPLIGQLFHE